jgi:hypothetical protein
MIEWLAGVSLKTKLAAAGLGAGAMFVVLLLIVLPMWGQLSATERQLDAAGKKLTATTAELTQCKANRLTLQDGIASANAEVERQRQAGEVAAAEGDRKLQEALKLAQTYKNRADKIARAKPSSPDQCVAAQSLIVTTLSEERQ